VTRHFGVVVLLDPLALGDGFFDPARPRWMGNYAIDVSLKERRNLHAIGTNAHDHRRIAGVGDRNRAEQEPVLSRAGEAAFAYFIDTADSGRPSGTRTSSNGIPNAVIAVHGRTDQDE